MTNDGQEDREREKDENQTIHSEPNPSRASDKREECSGMCIMSVLELLLKELYTIICSESGYAIK